VSFKYKIPEFSGTEILYVFFNEIRLSNGTTYILPFEICAVRDTYKNV